MLSLALNFLGGIKTKLIIAGIIIALGFAGGWKARDYIADSKELRQAEIRIQVLRQQIADRDKRIRDYADRLAVDAEIISDMEALNENLLEETRRNGGDSVVFDERDVNRLRQIFGATKP